MYMYNVMYMYMYMYMYKCTCIYLHVSTQGMIDNVLSNQSWSYVSQEFSRNARDPTAPRHPKGTLNGQGGSAGSTN